MTDAIILIPLSLGLLLASTLHCLREENPAEWLLAIFLLPVVGPVLYFGYYYVLLDEKNPQQLELQPAIKGREAQQLVAETLQKREQGVMIPGETESLGRACFVLGKWDDATKYFREFLEHRPPEEDLRTRYFLAQALLKQAQWKEAIEALQDVIAQEQHFDHGNALVLLGEAFLNFDDRERAEMSYEAALEKGEHPKAMYQLALLKIEAGNEDEGRKWLDKLIESAREAPKFYRRIARYWARQARAKKEELNRKK
jgi:hypothetical protein